MEILNVCPRIARAWSTSLDVLDTVSVRLMIRKITREIANDGPTVQIISRIC